MNKKILLELVDDRETKKILRDIFYSSLYYYSPIHGWSENAFENYIEDKSEESSSKDKIKVYIKEPDMPEYIQLWDKFSEEECKYWIEDSNKKVKKYYYYGLKYVDKDNNFVGFGNTSNRVLCFYTRIYFNGDKKQCHSNEQIIFRI